MLGNIDRIAGHAVREATGDLHSARLPSPRPILSKLEDDFISEMDRILAARIKEAEKKAIKTVTVAYEDFCMLDIRVGRVLTAEKVPKSNKLLKLKVDIGDDVRQIVAGMAQFTSPEEISGKLVVVVTNLVPAKLMGQESKGMVLAASDPSGKLVVITPSAEIASGSLVK